MFTKEPLLIQVLSFPSSCCLSGNGTPDGTPLKRELKSLHSIDLTELYKIIYGVLPLSIWSLKPISGLVSGIVLGLRM